MVLFRFHIPRLLTPLFWRHPIFFFWVKWLLLAALIGLLVGSAFAFFLVALEWATNYRIMQFAYFIDKHLHLPLQPVRLQPIDRTNNQRPTHNNAHFYIF